jgi:tRNA G18 (ribose-2'-O)-methylase SpoU
VTVGVEHRVVRIENSDDERIAEFRDIRERDLIGRRGRFIAEGEVVLSTLLGSSLHRPVSLLIAEKRLAKLAPLIDTVPADVPIHVAPQEVLDGIAGFHLHRGILALGERAHRQFASDLLASLPADALVMVLVGVANHDNVGGLFRNAAAFAADAVLLDPTSCDPLYRKSLRVSAGAVLRVPYARLGDGEEAVDLLKAHGFTPFAFTPGGAEKLGEVRRPIRAALIFGAEGPGLPEHVLQRCVGVRIPMAADFDSLNVATSSGIALHHFARGLM